VQEARDIARTVFDEIRESFTDLSTRQSESFEGEPQLEIPEQPGLRFDVTLYLYGDVLNLCAGQFWREWFPCSNPEVVSRYVEAVLGLLEGRFRIVEHSRNGRVLKAFLQRPSGPRWQNLSRHYHGLSLPWPKTEQRILQNLAA
jgi:hypothetical protein